MERDDDARTTVFLLLILGCAPGPETPVRTATTDSEYLYLWTASTDSTAPDFLAVLDVRPDTGRYGAVVASVPVGSAGNTPHHTEHQLAADRQLFASGFEFAGQEGYSHPHSFLRLPAAMC